MLFLSNMQLLPEGIVNCHSEGDEMTTIFQCKATTFIYQAFFVITLCNVNATTNLLRNYVERSLKLEEESRQKMTKKLIQI